jgi:ribonuclease P protein component
VVDRERSALQSMVPAHGRVKRRFRLTRSTDFQRVRQCGKSYAHPLLVLVVLPNLEENSRFGVTAGRSVGKAVQRNRAKRRLRAAVRVCLPMLHSGWDIIFIARRPILDASFKQIQAAMSMLLRRADLLCEVHEP